MHTGGSCFSGNDGIALAMRDAGILPRWHVERKAWCRDLLSIRFPRNKIFEDVKDVGQHNLTPVDVIFGGFPCQPFSKAGRKRGIEDERWLWPEFARIIGELQPAIVFLENSDNITAPTKRDGIIVATAPALAVVGSLTEMGFNAQWGIVPASAAGAPHQRDRWWCLAWNVSNARSLRQRKQEFSKAHQSSTAGHYQEAQAGRQATSIESGGAGHNLPNTMRGRLARSKALSGGYEQEIATSDRTRGEDVRHSQREGLERQASPFLEESTQLAQRSGFQQIGSPDVCDVGRVVFDGLPGRLERQKDTQLYASWLGLPPNPYEPPRITHDKFDWKDRVEAIGESVCVSVVRAFAEGIKAALDELYKEG